MAMINCPECGKQVSDKATACPNCAFPLGELRTDGMVRIKMIPSGIPKQIQHQFGRAISIYNYETQELLWQGKQNQIASFRIEKPTTLYFTKTLVGYEFTAQVEANKKYQFAVTNNNLLGIKWKNRFTLSEVDTIDSD